MEREFWKPGNMLYPVPAVMVSCRRAGEHPNILTIAWAGNDLFRSGYGIDFCAEGTVFL